MKVLWFTNTPCLAEDVLASKPMSGGWLKSLDKDIQQKVNLHIAFHYDKKIEPFVYGNTKYYPIYNKITIWSKIRNRYLLSRVEDGKFIRDYLKVIHEVNPDLIHVHGTENSFGCISEVINKIPIVLSVQGIVNEIFLKHKFTVIGRNSFSIERFRNFKKYKSMARIESKYLSNYNYIISKSDWSNYVIKTFNSKATIFQLDNHLRDSFYLEKNKWIYKKPTGKIIISTTMSSGYMKGLDTVLNAAEVLVKNKYNFEWRIAGIDYDSQTWKDISKDLGFNSGVIKLMGKLTEDQIVDLLLESNLYVTASRIENSPNNLNEALILGLPCIATFSGGTGSFIQDKVDGLLFQDGDYLALAGMILHLVENEDIARKFSNNGRIKALSRHDKRQKMDELLSIYSKILNNESSFK